VQGDSFVYPYFLIHDEYVLDNAFLTDLLLYIDENIVEKMLLHTFKWKLRVVLDQYTLPQFF